MFLFWERITAPMFQSCRNQIIKYDNRLTYFFTSEEIIYMNPHIFPSSDELTPRLWFK